MPRLGRFTRRKYPVPIVGWAPWPVWTGVENLDRPAGARRYTDCDLHAHDVLENGSFIKT
jgi:hypothetical protein